MTIPTIKQAKDPAVAVQRRRRTHLWHIIIRVHCSFVRRDGTSAPVRSTHRSTLVLNHHVHLARLFVSSTFSLSSGAGAAWNINYIDWKKIYIISILCLVPSILLTNNTQIHAQTHFLCRLFFRYAEDHKILCVCSHSRLHLARQPPRLAAGLLGCCAVCNLSLTHTFRLHAHLNNRKFSFGARHLMRTYGPAWLAVCYCMYRTHRHTHAHKHIK